MNPELARLQVLARWEQLRRASRDTGLVLPPALTRWSGFTKFAEGHLRVLTVAKQLVPLRLNWIQRRVWAAELAARRRGQRPWFMVLKYRKGGVTTLEQALAYWEIWRARGVECLTLAHEPKATRAIFRVVGRFYDNQPLDFRHDKTPAAVNHIEFQSRDAIYMAATAARTGSTGRGSTYTRAHLSEAAFYHNLGDEHTALSNSLGPTSAYVIESTANGRVGQGKTFHEFWQAAKRGEGHFIPLFFAWHHDPANQLPHAHPDEVIARLEADEEARELRARHALTVPQMAWWLDQRDSLRSGGQSSAKIHQEHPSDDETCFLHATDGYFDADLLDAATRRVRDPLAVEDSGRLRIHEVPDEDRPAGYVIAADPAEGVGGDDSAAVGLNGDTGRQALAYQNNRIPPDLFGEYLAALGWRWANPKTGRPAYLIVERNNHGHAVLAALRHAGYPEECIYHHVDASMHGPDDEAVGKRPGFPTTALGIAQMTTAVGRLLREGVPALIDGPTVSSIREVAQGPHGAVFRSRDLAVAAALATIALPYAGDDGAWGAQFAYVGGRVVKI